MSEIDHPNTALRASERITRIKELQKKISPQNRAKIDPLIQLRNTVENKLSRLEPELDKHSAQARSQQILTSVVQHPPKS